MKALCHTSHFAGLASEELNGDEYTAIPFEHENVDAADKMVIGYITKKNMLLSQMGERYIDEIKNYLSS